MGIIEVEKKPYQDPTTTDPNPLRVKTFKAGASASSGQEEGVERGVYEEPVQDIFG